VASAGQACLADACAGRGKRSSHAHPAHARLATALLATLAAGPALGQPAGWGRPPETRVEPPPPIPVELGATLGVAVRADDPPHFPLVERARLAFEASAFVTPKPAYSLGLAFEQAGLGRERSAVAGPGAVEVRRDMSALWAGVRLNLARGDQSGLGLGFGPGLLWQRLDASGVTGLGLTGVPVPFACSGSASVSLGLRAGVDGWLGLGPRIALVAGAGAEALRLSSDPLDGCAPGAGSATLLGLRAGFAYRFDVGRYVR